MPVQAQPAALRLDLPLPNRVQYSPSPSTVTTPMAALTGGSRSSSPCRLRSQPSVGVVRRPVTSNVAANDYFGEEGRDGGILQVDALGGDVRPRVRTRTMSKRDSVGQGQGEGREVKISAFETMYTEGPGEEGPQTLGGADIVRWQLPQLILHVPSLDHALLPNLLVPFSSSVHVNQKATPTPKPSNVPLPQPPATAPNSPSLGQGDRRQRFATEPKTGMDSKYRDDSLTRNAKSFDVVSSSAHPGSGSQAENGVSFLSSGKSPVLDDDEGIADYTFPSGPNLVLGRGKFSAVYEGWRDGKKYAVKHTPLYPHHSLIATRLLREPTILAQLPSHPNLIKVLEMIRTPGHFYLVEEFLEGYITLESLVVRQPDRRLSDENAFHVLYQLTSVVRSALHQPIQICHRDIKPENILIHPETLHLKLLDFGLSTHYSEREAKLTTCCGSPAYHSPELYLSLRSAPGAIKYKGPEIDVWCIGITLLRCLIGQKYPLGVGQHASIQLMSQKATDALAQVGDRGLRSVLSGLLDMDGPSRLDAFRSLELPASYIADVGDEREVKDFKSTTFIPSIPKHTLPLPLLSPPSSPYATPAIQSASSSRSTSRSRKEEIRSARASLDMSSLPDAFDEAPSHPPHSLELILSNPTDQPFKRVISFLKYALRCAGILYHIRNERIHGASSPTAPASDSGCEMMDPDDDRPIVLHCTLSLGAQEVQSKAATALQSALRPPLLRSATSRSSSTPPAPKPKKDAPPEKIRVLPFFMEIKREEASRSTSKSKSPSRRRSRRQPSGMSRIVVRISDKRALSQVREAFSIGKLEEEEEDEGSREAGSEPRASSRGRTSEKVRSFPFPTIQESAAGSTETTPTRRTFAESFSVPSTPAVESPPIPTAPGIGQENRTGPSDRISKGGGFFDFAFSRLRSQSTRSAQRARPRAESTPPTADQGGKANDKEGGGIGGGHAVAFPTF